MQGSTVSITLKPDLEKLVQESVLSGAYRSPEEVVLAGLNLLNQREQKLAALRVDLQIGIDQAEKGEIAPLDMEKLIGELVQNHAQKLQIL
jgi:antitoxin ParD1/3/4